MQAAHEHGLSAAARAFGTTHKTVRKGLTRYQAQGTKGLRDRSRGAPAHPHTSPAPLKQQALALRRRLPTWGGRRLKREGRLAVSGTTCDRIWWAHELVQPRRRRHYTRRDRRAARRASPPSRRSSRTSRPSVASRFTAVEATVERSQRGQLRCPRRQFLLFLTDWAM